MQNIYLGILFPLIFNHSDGFKESFINTSLDNNGCHTSDCLVEMSVKNNYSLESRSDKYSFYFPEGSHLLSEFQKEHVYKLAISSGEISFFITGYTDGCGSNESNLILANLRSNELAHQIKKVFPHSKINISIINEESTTHNPESRRVDLYFTKKAISDLNQQRYESDFYLVDGSGSMNGKFQKWMNVISYAKKKNSRVFLSTTQFYQNGISWFGVKPYGYTEIWHSYWKILDKMKGGQKLIIISDFEPTYPLTREEFNTLDNKVRRLGIDVIAIKA